MAGAIRLRRAIPDGLASAKVDPATPAAGLCGGSIDKTVLEQRNLAGQGRDGGAGTT